MDTSLKNLTLSELFSSSLYLERLFHAMGIMSSVDGLPEVKILASDMLFDINEVIETEILASSYKRGALVKPSVKMAQDEIKNATKLVESLMRLNIDPDKTVVAATSLINTFYKYAYQFHQILEQKTDLEIQLPRTSLSFEIKKENEIPQYELSLEHLMEVGGEKDGRVKSLNLARNEKYNKLLQEGHQLIYDKKLDEALSLFSRALNYKETAEILTLIGWAYGLKGKTEKAKSYCLKAIKKDPDYGPPYNDLGNYLLGEGQIKESLKWFSLAKKSVNYQNREYPYINSGRAYIASRDFKMALEEFSKALSLAPYHEELHDTVEKLKISLANDPTSNMTPPPSQ